MEEKWQTASTQKTVEKMLKIFKNLEMTFPKFTFFRGPRKVLSSFYSPEIATKIILIQTTIMTLGYKNFYAGNYTFCQIMDRSDCGG